MPTYEYRCTDCGQHIEVVQSFTDDPLTICGTCGGSLRKVFSPIGISFKGSGFYRTDSRVAGDGAKKKTKEKADGSAASTAAPSSDSKASSATSTSKSDSKSESKSA